jgi:hypothetical protein
MKKENPINTTEFNGEEVTRNAPKNTIDIQKFKQSLATDKEDKQLTQQLTWKDVKALKRSKYLEKKGRYKKSFIIQHKKTRAIAEINAISSIDACHFIGWKPRQVKLLEVINIQ